MGSPCFDETVVGSASPRSNGHHQQDDDKNSNLASQQQGLVAQQQQALPHRVATIRQGQ